MPEPLGYDESDEQARLVPGDAGVDAWPHQLGLTGVGAAGVLLRQIHEASADRRSPADAQWSVPFAPGPVVCHGDPQPANFVWRDGHAVGLFDWDAARPGQPVDDVAYALLWFSPFNADEAQIRSRGFRGRPDRRARAEGLLDGCGWDQPIDLVEAAVTRQAQALDEVSTPSATPPSRHAATAASWNWPARRSSGDS